jgi:putative Ca2+/H+ antiporter (TMEM165/GDT1 family)
VSVDFVISFFNYCNRQICRECIVPMRNQEILLKNLYYVGIISFIVFGISVVWQDGHDADDAKKSTADMTAFVSSTLHS